MSVACLRDRPRRLGLVRDPAGEPAGPACRAAIEADQDLLLSVGSLTEILVVAAGKDILDATQGFLAALQPTVVPLTESRARAAGEAYRRWGKGSHAAGLNLCDCFAYALADEHECPLLYIGNDFRRTNIISAMAA